MYKYVMILALLVGLVVSGEAMAMEAKYLCSEYSNNELRADSIYKGQRHAITGRITSIGKGIFGAPYIVLDNCVQYVADDAAIFISLNQGDMITIVGEIHGKTLGNVMVYENSESSTSSDTPPCFIGTLLK